MSLQLAKDPIRAFEESNIRGQHTLQLPVKQKQCVFSNIAIECPEHHDCPEAHILKGNKSKSIL